MNAWVFINLIWTAVLLVSSGGLYFIARNLEQEQSQIRKFYEWRENRERKQRQL